MGETESARYYTAGIVDAQPMINAPCGKRHARRPNKTHHQRLINVFTFHFSVEKIVAPSPYRLARFSPSVQGVSIQPVRVKTSFIPTSIQI